jgi:histidine triad (HIT) family protein
MDCIFCKIAAGELPSERIYEDEICVGFRDINPQAPVHVLVIPKAHLGNVAALTGSQAELAGRLLLACAKVAEQEGLLPGGYRLVANVGKAAGESVPHLHWHVIGGRTLAWPPG